MTRNGKIARLPRAVREELNARLADGEDGDALLSWLHRLPVVWTVLERDFEGRRITKQNLSQWRRGGFREWLARLEVTEEARELAGDGDDLRLLTKGRLADALATMLTARYAALIRNWDGKVEEGFERKAQVLRGLCRDITTLQRGEQRQWKLELERTEREKEELDAKEQVVGLFERWVYHPGVREVLNDRRLTAETRRQRLLEVSGFNPETYVSGERGQGGWRWESGEAGPEARKPRRRKGRGNEECRMKNEKKGRVAPGQSQSHQFEGDQKPEVEPQKGTEDAKMNHEGTKEQSGAGSVVVAPSQSQSHQLEGEKTFNNEHSTPNVQGEQSEVNPEDAKPDRERRKLYFRDRDLSDAEWRRKYGF